MKIVMQRQKGGGIRAALLKRRVLLCFLNLFLAGILLISVIYLLLLVIPSTYWLDFTVLQTRPIYLHYVRFISNRTSRELDFTDYLSVRSAVQYLKPDVIFLHSDFTPTGSYWTNLTDEGLIELVHMEKPTDFGKREGQPKYPRFIEHRADLAKLLVLLEYGGIAVDFDVYFLRGEKIKNILRKKKAITCYGDEDGNNIGFVAGWPDSVFLKAWRRSYQDIYVADDWNFNQAFVSKYLTALFPDEVYIADHICTIRDTEVQVDTYDSPQMRYFMSSMATHTYNRHGKTLISSPEDLERNVTYRSYLLNTIYHSLELPPIDPNFHDEVVGKL